MKRPHVDEFLQKMGELFECVLFTASLGKVRPIDVIDLSAVCWVFWVYYNSNSSSDIDKTNMDMCFLI